MLTRLAAVLAAVVVLGQVAYPLTEGEPLRWLTIATVVCFAAASLVHAAATRGAAWAAGLLVVAGGLGLAAEAVGVSTGYPFGRYAYGSTLGPQLLDVPVIVPLAWVMMSYPCLLLGRRLAQGAHGAGSVVVTAATGGLTLAAWDLYLDPQMVAAGRWAWTYPEPSLPGVAGVPATNYAGWLLVAVVIITTLHLLLPRREGTSDAVPDTLLGWTWLGSAVGNAFFFDRPAVALWGVTAMGLCSGPYLLRQWRSRR